MKRLTASVIVSVSFTDKDKGILLVGSQHNGKVDVINSFSGKEAFDLYKKLTTPKKEENHD